MSKSRSLITVNKLVMNISGTIIIVADKRELQEVLTSVTQRDQNQ